MTTRHLALLTLSGCFRVHHQPACDESGTEVTDSETTPAGTAADLLAIVTGGGASEGRLADETVVDVAWSVARGDGSARWVESVATTHTERTWGIGSTTQQNMVFCLNRLELPVVASVASDQGEVEVTVLTVAEAHPADEGGASPYVFGTTGYGDATFPAGVGEDPDDFSDKSAFLGLDGLGSDGVSGSAGWEGTRETETATERRAVDVLEFPVPD